jgi:hypothetical protein
MTSILLCSPSVMALVLGYGDGHIEGAAFYASIKNIYDSAVVVDRATHAFLMSYRSRSVDHVATFRHCIAC